MAAHVLGSYERRKAHPYDRRYPRAVFTIPITLRYLSHGGVRMTRGMSLDLGVGGLGAIVQGNVVVGDTVSIDLRLCEQSLTTVAIVRHTSKVSSGFEFVGLTAEERLKITSMVGSS